MTIQQLSEHQFSSITCNNEDMQFSGLCIRYHDYPHRKLWKDFDEIFWIIGYKAGKTYK